MIAKLNIAISPRNVRIILAFIIFISTGILSAAELTSFQEDFAFFTKTLKEAHPNIYDGTPDFDLEAEKTMQELVNVSDISEFKLLLTRFTHKL